MVDREVAQFPDRLLSHLKQVHKLEELLPPSVVSNFLLMYQGRQVAKGPIITQPNAQLVLHLQRDQLIGGSINNQDDDDGFRKASNEAAAIP